MRSDKGRLEITFSFRNATAMQKLRLKLLFIHFALHGNPNWNKNQTPFLYTLIEFLPNSTAEMCAKLSMIQNDKK